jgi:DNA-binding response OmpR family regulator
VIARRIETLSERLEDLEQTLETIRPRLAEQGEAAVANRQASAGSLMVDYDAHRVFADGVEVALSPTEYRLLGELVLHAGKVVRYSQLARRTGSGNRAGRQQLKVYVGRLRSKLSQTPAAGSYRLEAVRGSGYRLVA